MILCSPHSLGRRQGKVRVRVGVIFGVSVILLLLVLLLRALEDYN
jgi:hypothetical protein